MRRDGTSSPLRAFARAQWPSLVACGLALVLCVVALHTIRLDFGPDEPDHLQYVHIIAREGRLPTPEDTHSVQHPPLYFALMALPYRLGGSEIAPFSSPTGPARLATMTPGERRSRYLCRYLQVILTVLTLWVIGAVLREVLPERPWLRAATLLGLAGWPLLAWGGAVVNNDMLVTLWSGVLVLLALRQVRSEGGSAARSGALLGLLMGLGLWMKLTVIYCAPAVVALVWWHQRGRAERVRFALVFGLVMLAVGCWWYVRCGLVFGDPFPNFAGQMGTEARTQALLRHDLFGAGLDFLLRATRDIARACLLPEFLWPVWRGGAGLVSLALVRGLVLLTAVCYLAFALLGAGRPSRLSARVAAPAALALALACAMVMYYAVTKDLRAITSAGRYMLTAAVWGALLVAGAGERLALLLTSPGVRVAVLACVLLVALLAAAGFQWLLSAWYGAIG